MHDALRHLAEVDLTAPHRQSPGSAGASHRAGACSLRGSPPRSGRLMESATGQTSGQPLKRGCPFRLLPSRAQHPPRSGLGGTLRLCRSVRVKIRVSIDADSAPNLGQVCSRYRHDKTSLQQHDDVDIFFAIRRADNVDRVAAQIVAQATVGAVASHAPPSNATRSILCPSLMGKPKTSLKPIAVVLRPRRRALVAGTFVTVLNAFEPVATFADAEFAVKYGNSSS